MNQRIRISNNKPFSVTLWLEPWGEDYGMNPNDEFEIIAEDVGETFYFHISCDENSILVYPEGEGGDHPNIFYNGVEIFCGHNRRE